MWGNGTARSTRLRGDCLQTRDVLGKHVAELTGHAVDSALYGGHGHLVGKQGPRGHDMVRSDLDKQGGQYIPQACGKAGCPFDDPQQDDYGKVDAGD